MRYKPESLGTLVRPRMLAKGKMIPLKEVEHFVDHLSSPNFNEELASLKLPSEELASLFASQDVLNKFKGLSLGDTTIDTTTAYVAEITHFLIRENGGNYLVNKKTLPEAIKRRKERHGPRAKLYIHSLGVKLYKGFEVLKGGKFRPVDPWQPEGAKEEVILFFSQYDCIPMEQIVHYEACLPGDLILFSKSNGLVVQKKKLNKPKFQVTSSWTCYSLTLLNNSSFARFVPNRKFTSHRPERSG
jgi:hypothetical protein